MKKLRPFLKKCATPITIMLVPHSRSNAIRFKLPFLALAGTLLFSVVGAIYTVSLSFQAIDYYRTKRKLAYLSGQFQEMQATMSALKESESQFKRIFSFKSKKQVFTAMENDNNGSIDIEELKKQISASMAAVSEIKEYLAKQKDAYVATPEGWPVEGRISSGFGMREHPLYHTEKFHSGVDLSVPTGTAVKATASGIVSFASWSPGNGNIVVLEHGQGFSTVYAHNSRNRVRVGQTVRRGELIAEAGSTGVATGSHVHYEVWKNGKCVDPATFGEKKG